MIHIIHDLSESEYTREDGQLVENWLVSHGEDIADEIEKRRIATADMSEEAFHHLEVPTGIAAESRLGKAMIKMAQQAPETFELLFIIQGAIHRILPVNTPIKAKVADIMNIDDNFSTQPEVVIVLDV